MNRLSFCVWVALGLAAGAGVDVPAAAEADSAGTLSEAKVTLPYPELKALLAKALVEDALRKEPPPPVESALLSSRYRLELGEGASTLDARFEAAAFGEGWRLVPLLGSDLAPASIEPPDANVIAKDGVLCALVHGPGRVSVSLRFLVPGVRDNPARPFLKLRTQPGTSATLAVGGLGKGERLRVDGAPYAVGRSGDIPLPAAGAALELVLEEDRPPVPSQWAATAAVFVERDEAFLRYTAEILADAVDGSGLEMALDLPADGRELGVEGPGISHWEVERQPGRREILRIAWSDAGARSRELLLRWRTPPRGDAERWAMECPRPQEARSFDVTFIAARPQSIALEVDPPSAAAPGVAVPGWVREKLGVRDYIVAAAGAALVPRSLKTADTEQATVRSSKCTTTLVGDGSALGQGEFEIEHAASVRWRVRLPEGSRLLKCAAGGAVEKPVLGEDGGLEFLLPASSQGVSKVTLSYTEKKAAMDPVGGRVSLGLPSTPLFTDRIEWQLLLPEAYEVTAVDGNLDPGKGDGASLVLEKRLCRGETPAVDIHYRKKGPRE